MCEYCDDACVNTTRATSKGSRISLDKRCSKGMCLVRRLENPAYSEESGANAEKIELNVRMIYTAK